MVWLLTADDQTQVWLVVTDRVKVWPGGDRGNCRDYVVEFHTVQSCRGMVHSMVLPRWYGWYAGMQWWRTAGGMGGMLQSPAMQRHACSVHSARSPHSTAVLQSYSDYDTGLGHDTPGTGASSGAMIQHTTSSRPRPISHPPATPPTGQRSLEMKTNLREV